MFEEMKKTIKVSEHEYRYIGKHGNRADAVDLVSGRQKFLDDMVIPGMLVVRVLRSPHANAIIKSINLEKARALPGVIGVASYKEAPDWKCGLPNHRRVLDQHVRFVGDSVALVAAETIEIADEALDLIEVEYEVLPFVLDCEEALSPDAPQLYEEYPGNEIPKVTPFSEEPFNQIFVGDTKAGFAEADYVAEGYMKYENMAHPLPPESPGCIAQWTSPSAVTVWYNGGAPHLQKFNTEGSIPGVAVRVIACHAGGSYGSKQLIPHMILQAVFMAKLTGRTCKFIMDRTEHLLSYELRQGSRIRGKVGMTKDGIINAVEGMWYTDSGMSSTYAQAMTAVGLGECQAFLGKCKNWALDTKLVATNHSSQAPIRGFGGQECKSVLVPMVCTAIRKAGMDPLEVFQKNFVKEGDRYIWRDNLWWDVHSVDYTKAFEESAKAFGWKDKWKGWEKPYWVSEDGRYARGVGVGVHGNADIGEDPTEGMVKLHPFGSVTLELCVGETGGAQRFAVQKMVAEVMKVPLDGVQVVDPDTHGTGYDAGMIGSRGTITMGTTAVRAANDARRQLLELAAVKLNTNVEDLDTEDFMVYAKSRPEMRLPWIAVCGTPEMTITGSAKYKQNFDKPNFALYLADVEVNLMTGEAKLIRALEGTDVGQIIDPINIRMQAEGSFGSAGGDTGLFEEMVMDKKLGRFMTGNMIDYKWRTFNEFPQFDTVILESEFDSEAFHALGFGEITPSPAPAAILMAVSNAIGHVITEYPCSPTVVLRAMGKIKPACARRSVTPPIHESMAGAWGIPEHMPPARRQDFQSNKGEGEKHEKFDYIKAASYEEAGSLIREGGGKREAIAGGTDLLGTLKDKLLPEYPEAVVSLEGIPDSAYIREEGDRIAIGAGTKLKDIAASDIVKEGCAALAEAAYSVASPLIRNTATIGGNICQDVRCWYYRYPDSIGGRLVCKRKGGDTCYAIAGENRYHSIFGGMCTGASACQHACPAGTDIPGYMAKIREDDWAGAAEIFLKYNPMPMMTSRVCPHGCTGRCNQNVYGESVNIPAVERTLGDYILAHKEVYYKAPEEETGKKCAVIGAGPGGLTAAFYLRKAGHAVTVYDAHEKAGGVLRYGIPHYRLPKNIVDEFCGALEELMGIRFVMNTKVGTDITVEEIRNSHDAVYFGTGAWSQPVLGLEGENLTQFGLNFLEEVNTYLQKAIGEEVLVCGGGNVAMDVALTAKRLGAKTVKLVCLEQREEMPASEEEIAMALEEGVELFNGWGLGRVLNDQGRVTGLQAKRCLSVRDEKGRFAPKYDEEDCMELSSDFIILATGQKVDIRFLGEKLYSELKTERGLIDADAESGRTRKEGFYAGGDAVTGPDLAIRAIAAGRSAAAAMNVDLGTMQNGADDAQGPDEADGAAAADGAVEPDGAVLADRADKADGADSAGNGFTTFNVQEVENTVSYKLEQLPASARTLAGEDRRSLDQDTAKKEAERCLHCACYAVNPSDITPVLVMAGAEIVTTARVISAKDLFTRKLTVQQVLHAGELVKEIRVPKSMGQNHYDKRRVRNAIDFAIVSLASDVKLEAGIIKDCRLVLGGVAPVPYALPEVEVYLRGKTPGPEAASEAGEIAMKNAFPMSNNEYKVFMCKDAIYRMVMRLAE